jgi:dihydrofolate reductase
MSATGPSDATGLAQPAAKDCARSGLSVIVARAKNGVIGYQGKLPWHISEDLQWFRSHTLGHTVMMGRKTFESIGRPLPKRTNIVISRNSSVQVDGRIIASSLQHALTLTTDSQPFVIGGAQLYAEALPLAQHVYITEVDSEPTGDAFLPSFDETAFAESFRAQGLTKDPRITFRILTRRFE